MYRTKMNAEGQNLLNVALRISYQLIQEIEEASARDVDCNALSKRFEEIKLKRGKYTYSKDDIATCTIIRILPASTLTPYLTLTVTVVKNKSQFILLVETHIESVEKYSNIINHTKLRISFLNQFIDF